MSCRTPNGCLDGSLTPTSSFRVPSTNGAVTPVTQQDWQGQASSSFAVNGMSGMRGLSGISSTAFGIQAVAQSEGRASIESVSTHMPAGGASDLNMSVSSTSRQSMGFERRVAWLEEDVSLMQRRIRNELGDGVGGSSSDADFRARVARLDAELAAEVRAREAMEQRMSRLEEQMLVERTEREVQLQSYSTDLESTMRGLITRIDDSLSINAASMRQRTESTEARLRTLIHRVDEGLSANAVALEESLATTHATVGSAPVAASTHSPLITPQVRTAPAVEANGDDLLDSHQLDADAAFLRSVNMPASLMASWNELRQENERLLQRQAALRARSPSASQGGTPSGPQSGSATPTGSYPFTMQVPGTGVVNAQTVSRAPTFFPNGFRTP